MNSPSIGLCLLTFNEIEGCRSDVPLLATEQFDQVFCVDGGSSDGTDTYLASLGIEVHQQPSPGLNGAYVHAARVAKVDALVVFFPKGTVPVSVVSDIRGALLQGAEFVSASRNMRGGRNEEDARIIRLRKWFTQGLGLVVALLWRREGTYLTDVLHGIKGYRLDRFRQLRVEERGYAVDLCMAARAYKLRLRRFEVPAIETARRTGQTHFRALSGGAHLLGFLIREILRLNPGQKARADTNS